MGSVRTQSGAAMGSYEPVLTHQLLRGCACGSPHPIALRSLNSTICPGCGAPAIPPGTPRTERASLPGFWGAICTALLSIGAALHRLARRIEP